jgi:hypothetical protein
MIAIYFYVGIATDNEYIKNAFRDNAACRGKFRTSKITASVMISSGLVNGQKHKRGFSMESLRIKELEYIMIWETLKCAYVDGERDDYGTFIGLIMMEDWNGFSAEVISKLKSLMQTLGCK